MFKALKNHPMSTNLSHQFLTNCSVCCVVRVQDLTAALVARVQAGPTEVVEELKARLALKEKLFQELLGDRSRQSKEHQAQIQDLLSTLSSKDQYLQVGDIATLKCSW